MFAHANQVTVSHFVFPLGRHLLKASLHDGAADVRHTLPSAPGVRVPNGRTRNAAATQVPRRATHQQRLHQLQAVNTFTASHLGITKHVFVTALPIEDTFLRQTCPLGRTRGGVVGPGRIGLKWASSALMLSPLMALRLRPASSSRESFSLSLVDIATRRDSAAPHDDVREPAAGKKEVRNTLASLPAMWPSPCRTD